MSTPARKRPHHAVILGHPASESFNAAAAQAYCDAVRSCGHTFVVRDLYGMQFDPVLTDRERGGEMPGERAADIECEVRFIRSADVFVLVYPIWYGSPPAMIKGYIERVFGAGFGHRMSRTGDPHPWLNGKALLSITTSGSPIQWLERRGVRAALTTLFDDYLADVFSMATTEHLHIPGVVEGLGGNQFAAKLARVTEQARATCAEQDRMAAT